MEQVAKYTKAISLGGLVLLSVLGVQTDASALPCVCESFSGGDVCVTSIGTSGFGTYQFEFQATTPHGGTLGNFTSETLIETVDITHTGLTALAPSDGTLSLPCGEQGDTWTVVLEDIGTPRGGGTLGTGEQFTPVVCNGSLFPGNNAGDFTFTEGTSAGVITTDTLTNAEFSVNDPFGGDIHLTPDLAPEIDANSAANPIALLVTGMVLLASGRRRDNQAE
jgi:hypothetical protein